MGKRYCEVGRDRRLTNATLARSNEHDSCSVVGVGEGDVAPFGVTVRWVVACRACGVALKHLTDVGSFFVVHDGEVDRRALHAEPGKCVGDSGGDFVLERAPGNGERYLHIDCFARDGDVLDHAQIDDAAKQFGVFNRTQRLDDLIFGDRHW